MRRRTAVSMAMGMVSIAMLPACHSPAGDDMRAPRADLKDAGTDAPANNLEFLPYQAPPELPPRLTYGGADVPLASFAWRSDGEMNVLQPHDDDVEFLRSEQFSETMVLHFEEPREDLPQPSSLMVFKNVQEAFPRSLPEEHECGVERSFQCVLTPSADKRSLQISFGPVEEADTPVFFVLNIAYPDYEMGDMSRAQASWVIRVSAAD